MSNAITVFSARRFEDDEDSDLRVVANAYAIRDMRAEGDHPAGIAIYLETPKLKQYEVIIAEDQLIAAWAALSRFREQDLLRDQVLAAMTTPHPCDGVCK